MFKGAEKKPEEGFVIPNTPADQRPPRISAAQAHNILEMFPYRKRIKPLNGLLLVAKTLPELHLKIRNAIESARNNGGLPPISKADADFRKLRDRAQKRNAKRANAQSGKIKKSRALKTPKDKTAIGTFFGSWETLTLPYYPEQDYPKQMRYAMVDCKCACGALATHAISHLRQRRSNGCKPCSAVRMKAEKLFGKPEVEI